MAVRCNWRRNVQTKKADWLDSVSSQPSGDDDDGQRMGRARDANPDSLVRPSDNDVDSAFHHWAVREIDMAQSLRHYQPYLLPAGTATQAIHQR